MVSSIGHREMVYKAISLGAKHFVTKPYEPDYAGMIIKSILNTERRRSTMRYEYIEPFVASTIKVLDNVMQTDITQGKISLVTEDEISGDVAIIVKVKGDSEGHIILNMYADTALNISNIMFGEQYRDTDPDGNGFDSGTGQYDRRECNKRSQ